MARTGPGPCGSTWNGRRRLHARAMKPAAFTYHAPRSLDEALALLAEHGDEGKLLAGGQSLVPAMNFRLARPAVLIDINRIAALDFLTGAGRLAADRRADPARRLRAAGGRGPARRAPAAGRALRGASADPRQGDVRRQPGARRPRGRMEPGRGDARRSRSWRAAAPASGRLRRTASFAPRSRRRCGRTS